MYQVISKEGQVSEPMNVYSLQTLAHERKLEPQQMLIDPISGRTLPAVEMLADQIVFPQREAVVAIPTQAVPQPDAALLGLRFGGYLIDSLCAIPLAIPAMIPYVGILFAPLLGLYWISRDSFFGGQSLGKKVVGLKVVRLDGKPFDWGTSVRRNIVFIPLLSVAIPGAGFILGPGLLGIINIVEIFLVLTTQRRIGDNIAQTVVVRA